MSLVCSMHSTSRRLGGEDRADQVRDEEACPDQCQQAGMTPLVPKPLTSGSRAEGRFDKRDFVYNAKRDEYRCPAGERAIWRF
jgi:hypothetical protein